MHADCVMCSCVHVQVTVDVRADTDCAALCMELWCPSVFSERDAYTMGPDTSSLEKFMGSYPLLLLSTDSQPAADELNQLLKARPSDAHTDSQSDSERNSLCVLEDLCMWVAYGTAAQASDSASGAELVQLGSDLLGYTVQNHMLSVARWMVRRLEPQAVQRAATTSAWLLHASRNTGRTTSLLHAAMASGHADTLAKVIR